MTRTVQFSKFPTNLAQSAVTLAQDGRKTGLLNMVPTKEVVHINEGAYRIVEAFTALGENIVIPSATTLRADGCKKGYVHRAVR